jgi:hypothetical protein
MKTEEIELEVFRVILVTNNLKENMKECINFSHYLLDNNIETENIYILAGLKNDEYYDIKKYFEYVSMDLNINIDFSDKYLGIKYLKKIANAVIHGKKDPIKTVFELSKMKEIIFPDFVHNDFIEMADNIDLIKSCTVSIIPGMDADNLNEYIIHYFELFLQAQELNLPRDIYSQAYCKKCKNRVKPKLKKKGILKKHYEYLCPKCNGNEFIRIKYNEGMDLYLKEKKLLLDKMNLKDIITA